MASLIIAEADRFKKAKRTKAGAGMEIAKPTIFALSSGHGRAGVAVIRICGPAAGGVLDAMAPPRPRPRFAALRRLRHPATGEVLDHALLLWFPGPGSETGEDMAELHVHGGRAVVGGVFAALAQMPSCRLAEPGEFARRAFENGKLDLTAVEGLADLIDAETAAQRRQALRQTEGALYQLYNGWRGGILAAMALMEAGIDFADEPDVMVDAVARACAEAAPIAAAVRAHLADGHRGELVRDGMHVVLAGPPNVGKSSLLNALARRDVAIVSEEPGTTRDVIEVKLELAGLPVVLSDTAGLRSAAGKVEAVGIKRAMERMRAADLVLWLVDAAAPQATPPPAELGLGADRLLVLFNKSDLVPATDHAGDGVPGEVGGLAISALTGFGVSALIDRLTRIAAERVGDQTVPALTQARHRQQLLACEAGLSAFLVGPKDEVELRAEDLRRAAQALGRLVGAIDVEEVLDQVFGRFCIGK
ncbi:MAG TPA: tRNA uridine-5-carboxymethylaminomethyl(34) synthesis GTPase MnmE [Hyphomicrobiaceae bacterium]|nr:tRNA uridine-5-carboxymethylaminomethyl(34) synthesis GTPase MnmE [Hyphomicrobiaceae bacterium]